MTTATVETASAIALPYALLLALGMSACGASNAKRAPVDGGLPDSGSQDAGFPAAGCEASNGLCMPAGTCTSAGGTVVALGGCFFDDGPAECCVPPAPKTQKTTCEDHGGLCAPIGGCLQAGGWITPPSEDTCNLGASYACCVPHAQCGDATMDCCASPTVYRQSCADGVLTCAFGTPVPFGTCP